MAGDRDRDACCVRSGGAEEEPSWLDLGPRFPSLRFPNPAVVLSSLIQTVTLNLQLFAVHPCHSLKKSDLGFYHLSSFKEEDHKPIVSALPVPYLALNSFISPADVSSKPRDDPAAKDGDHGVVAASEKGDEVASTTGPAFIGQVYTMCDASRRGLIAVRPSDVLKKIKMPPYMKFMERAYERAMKLLLVDGNMDGPVFRFYFNRDDAAEYVRRLNVSGSTVGACSLDAAYRYYKTKQDGTFKFMADQRQVRIARELVRRDSKAAKELRDVIPVFTARNLTIAMSTPRGVRWFRPYFFNKKQLDNLINHSVDHYYELLISARKAQRHSQLGENSRGDSFAGGESMEDDPLQDGLMDPPEVQELMEELGQGGGGGGVMELVGSFEAQVMDLADRLLLGHQWSRRMILHVEPRFPVIVDSFERLVSASEVDGGDEGPSDDTSSTTNSAATKGASSDKSAFSLFGKKWGVNGKLLFRRRGSGDAGELEEKESDSECLEEGTPKGFALQPKLTMVGIADGNKVAEEGLQQAMASAAKDVEDRARKGEGGPGPELGPLFIANLGAK